MEGIFLEYENENSLRSFPFAAGCQPVGNDGSEIPSGVFVDACLYPINPSGTLYLSGVSKDGVVSVSDSSGVVMQGDVGDDRVVELYSASGMRRHLGQLVAGSKEALDAFAFRGKDVSFGRESTTFASSCVFPVVIDGVVSVDVGGTGQVAGTPGFANGPYDAIRVSSGSKDGRKTLRFDVVPPFASPQLDSIRQIRCVVDGRTPFRIGRLSYNTVLVYLQGIDKDRVCANAHRENAYEMADTCDCDKVPAREEEIPYAKQQEIVDIPPSASSPHLADSAFYLVSSNVSGAGNPISITLKDGVAIPKTTELKVESDNSNNGYIVPESELLGNATSKGVVIQVPGLSGGEI